MWKTVLYQVVAIQVNETDVYNFFVMEDNGTEATLLMDRNLGEDVYWNADGEDTSRGPVTALNQLNSYTVGWTKIAPIVSYSYINNPDPNNYGYRGLQIINGVGTLTSEDGSTKTQVLGTSRARMITFAEVESLAAGNYWFIQENFSEPPRSASSDVDSDKPIVLPLTSTTIQYSPNGYTDRVNYWTLTTNSTSVRHVSNNGFGDSDRSTEGLRPVITLKK